MPRPRTDIQPRIVEAARARFLAQGVDGASLREIARDAGTSIGMVGYYFPTKDDLFLAVVEEAYSRVVDDMAKILQTDRTAQERLRGAFVRLGHSTELELEVVRLVAREALSSSKRLRRILARFMRGHLPLLLSTIADGMRNGEIDSTIPAPLVLLACVGVGALPQVLRRATGSLPLFSILPNPEQLADLSIRILFRAVGPAGRSARPGRR
jgi:TetR/AcrR family transcriptional regulator